MIRKQASEKKYFIFNPTEEVGVLGVDTSRKYQTAHYIISQDTTHLQSLPNDSVKGAT